MTGTIYVFNGPNLNLLGEREPEIYGHETLADVHAMCAAVAEPHGFSIDLRQTNIEHELVEWFQEVRKGAAGVVFNPAAFSYAAYSILDAIKLIDCPVIEVHIRNVHHREKWRADSIMSAVCSATLTGFGVHGYVAGVENLIWRSKRRAS